MGGAKSSIKRHQGAVNVSASSTVIEVNVCFDSQDADIDIIGLFFSNICHDNDYFGQYRFCDKRHYVLNT